MLSSTKKDKKRRSLVKKFEIKSLQAKVFSQDLSLKGKLFLRSKNSKPISLYSFLSQKIEKGITRNSSKVRIKNRCIETGRCRAVLRFCKLSRIVLREKASKGLISGVNKASW